MVVRGLVRRVVRGVVRRVVRGVGSVGSPRSGGQFFQLSPAFVPEILLVLRHSLVRFLPQLLIHKYHVLSMKYFVDVTLFIPK